jgi:hypothetical protein
MKEDVEIISEWEFYQEELCDIFQKRENLKETSLILKRWEKEIKEHVHGKI